MTGTCYSLGSLPAGAEGALEARGSSFPIPLGGCVSAQPKEAGEGCSSKTSPCLQFPLPLSLPTFPPMFLRHFRFTESARRHLPHQKTATAQCPPHFAESTGPARGGTSGSKTTNAALPSTPGQGACHSPGCMIQLSSTS